MSIFRRIGRLAVIVSTFSVVAALAQDVKVGAVNVDRVMRDAAASKAASTKLEVEFSKRQKEIDAVAAQLKASTDKLERDAPTLSESQRSSRQRQLVEQDRDLQRKQRDFQEELNARRNEELQAVVEKMNRAIKQLAESEKYDLIIHEAAYINPRLEVTDKVIAAMNGSK